MPAPCSPTRLSALSHFLAQSHPIPDALEKRILPGNSLSVQDLLQFPFPCLDTEHHRSTTAEFIRREGPSEHSEDTLVDLILSIAIPAREVVADLADECKLLPPGTTSIIFPHAPHAKNKDAPLWFVTFWLKALDVIATHRQPWETAK